MKKAVDKQYFITEEQALYIQKQQSTLFSIAMAFLEFGLGNKIYWFLFPREHEQYQTSCKPAYSVACLGIKMLSFNKV